MERTEKWAILRAAWIQAAKDGEVIFTFDATKQAKYMKAELYRAVKRAEKTKTRDEELLEAAGKCSISWKENTIRIYKRKLYPALETLKVVSTNNDADKSLAQMLSKLQGSAPKNPYFKQGDE